MSQRNLTDADVEAIANALKGHTGCNLGLTTDQAVILKRFLGVFDKAASLVGAIVLTAIVGGAIVIFTKGFWLSLITGVKQGGQ